MNYYQRSSGGFLSNVPEVTKNLLIINVLMFLATVALPWNLIWELGAFYPDSPNFKPYQIASHMFMHGGFSHLFFNMFALWMFGAVLERTLGAKRFLFFYLFTGLGAFFLHYLVQGLEVMSITDSFTWDLMRYDYSFEDIETLKSIYRTPVVGASGAIFGLLVGFALYYPNQPLMLIFIPVPIKAKYFVGFYGLAELYMGFNMTGGSIAHFAHLGGLLFGWILIKIWQKKDKQSGNHGYQEH